MDTTFVPTILVNASPRFEPKCLQICYDQITYLITQNSRIVLTSDSKGCYLVDTFNDIPLHKYDFPWDVFELLLKYNCMFHQSCNRNNYSEMFDTTASFLMYYFDLDAMSSIDPKDTSDIEVIRNSISMIPEVANWMLSTMWNHANNTISQNQEYYFQNLIQSATILSADLPNIPYPNFSFSYEDNSAMSDLIRHLEKLADYAVEHRECCKLPGTAFAFRNIISYMRG